jgi:hypothetical protein
MTPLAVLRATQSPMAHSSAGWDTKYDSRTRRDARAQAESWSRPAVSMQRATAYQLLLSRELAASSPSTCQSYCEQQRPRAELRTENAEFKGSFNGVFMFDLLPLFRCFPEVWRGRFGLFLCHSLLLALAFLPPGWGLVSDSGTMVCLELLW